MTRETGTLAPAPSTLPPEPLTLTASDGLELSAWRYPAQGAIRGHLVVAGATGVPQRFYRRFAEHASARGFATLTFDYRGIAQSRHTALKGFCADQLDWATRDLMAAVEAMATDALPLCMIGHSFGGHALGLLPNHDRVARLYTFATGAGWHGWMTPLERLKAVLMWRFVGPAITHWKGYLAWSLLGMGEDLPLGVYRQWRRWCHFPRYFFDDPEMSQRVAPFADVRTPIIAVNATDDAWAPPRSRDAFMAGYSGTQWLGVDIDPRTLGLKHIGHMGYFRAGSEPLWQRALDWFEAVPHRSRPWTAGSRQGATHPA